MKLRFLVAAVLLIPLIFLGSKPAFADSKFGAAHNVTYTIEAGGTTDIVQNVDLKNLTANFYATQYTLSIGATHIKNVAAADSGGSSIPLTVSTDNDTTKITLNFNQKIVGLGRAMTFKITYQSDDIAVKNGFVWEVTIPKLASTESIDSYNLDLRAPKDIGTLASVSPEPVRQTSDGDFNVFSFNKDQLIQSGVNASFGDHQVFSYTLKYHLANNRFFPVFQTVALPLDTETQTVVYDSLTPKPIEITVDTDGNYLAKYRIDGNQKLDVILTGQVRIWNKPTNPPRSDWTKQDLSKYTSNQKYWDTTYPAIAQKAKELKTAQAIYNYVSTTLKYDYTRASGKLERLGAATAFNQPTKAVCMEYTDLFIAMARAAGIPAREVDGFAYTTNSKLKPRSFVGSSTDTKSDILHAWAEYWNSDQKRWIQVDPTWGSTTGGVDYFNKLDMNHFAFVVKGLSSVDPAPAGSYKTDPNNQTGDVGVTIAPSEEQFTINPSLKLKMSSDIIAGLPFSGQVSIINSGNSTVFGTKISVSSSDIAFSSTDVGPIPPLSTVQMPVNGRTSDFNASSTDKVSALLTGVDAKTNQIKLEDHQVVTILPIWRAALPWLVLFSTCLLGVYLLVRNWVKIRLNIYSRILGLLKYRRPNP